MSDFVQSLRELNVLVVHPRDSTADEFLQQIHRIGCSYQSIWPAPAKIPEKTDLLVVEVSGDRTTWLKSMIASAGRDGIATIAIIGYENPSIFDVILDIGAHAIIARPVRATGVMSSIFMARKTWLEQVRLRSDYDKIKLRMDNIQVINDAKFILMRHHNVNDKDAYAIIRKHAMSRRTTTIDIAQAIINATGILGDIR